MFRVDSSKRLFLLAKIKVLRILKYNEQRFLPIRTVYEQELFFFSSLYLFSSSFCNCEYYSNIDIIIVIK